MQCVHPASASRNACVAGTYLTRQAAYLLQEAAGIQDLLYTHSLRASMIKAVKESESVEEQARDISQSMEA